MEKILELLHNALALDQAKTEKKRRKQNSWPSKSSIDIGWEIHFCFKIWKLPAGKTKSNLCFLVSAIFFVWKRASDSMGSSNLRPCRRHSIRFEIYDPVGGEVSTSDFLVCRLLQQAFN